MNTAGERVQGRYTLPLPTTLSARWGKIFDVFRDHYINFLHITEAVLSIVYMERTDTNRSDILNSHWETVIDVYSGSYEKDITDGQLADLMDAFYSAVDLLENFYHAYQHAEPFCYGEYFTIDSIWEAEDLDGIVMETTVYLRSMADDDREDLLQLYRTNQYRRSTRARARG